MSNSNEISVSRSLAPEDIRVGTYVAVLHEIYEYIPHLACADDASWRAPEVQRVRWLPNDESGPMKVKAVCLPFVFVKLPGGGRRMLDVREKLLAEVSEDFARLVFKAERPKRKKERDGNKKCKCGAS